MENQNIIQKLITIESYIENSDYDMANYKCEHLREELLKEQTLRINTNHEEGDD